MFLRYAFDDCIDGKLFNTARLRAKAKIKTSLIGELLFADDDALTSHTDNGLQ